MCDSLSVVGVVSAIVVALVVGWAYVKCPLCNR